MSLTFKLAMIAGLLFSANSYAAMFCTNANSSKRSGMAWYLVRADECPASIVGNGPKKQKVTYQLKTQDGDTCSYRYSADLVYCTTHMQPADIHTAIKSDSKLLADQGLKTALHTLGMPLPGDKKPAMKNQPVVNAQPARMPASRPKKQFKN